MPTGRVIRAGPEVDTNGHRNLFQAPMNTKIDTAASMGRDSGSITDQKIRRWPAPSRPAASSSSRGMVWKCFFRMNTITRATVCGRMTAAYVPTRFGSASAGTTARSASAARYAGM